MARKPVLAFLASILVSQVVGSQLPPGVAVDLLAQGKNFKIYSSGKSVACQGGYVPLWMVFAPSVRIPDEREYRTFFQTAILPAAKRYCGEVNQVHVFHFFDGYFPPGSAEGDVGSADLQLVADSKEWTVKVRGFRSVEERTAFARDGESAERAAQECEATRARIRRDGFPPKDPVLEKTLQLGVKAWDLRADDQSYRLAIDVFADVCGKAYLDGCLRLDRAIDLFRANCMGDSEDRQRKPSACGLFGYALDKSPVLCFDHYFKNIPSRRGPLIGESYQTACKAGITFYCKTPTAPASKLEPPRP